MAPRLRDMKMKKMKISLYPSHSRYIAIRGMLIFKQSLESEFD